MSRFTFDIPAPAALDPANEVIEIFKGLVKPSVYLSKSGKIMVPDNVSVQVTHM